MSVEPPSATGIPQEYAPPSGNITPERLRGITARLENKRYDQPEVLDRIARRVLLELGK